MNKPTVFVAGILGITALVVIGFLTGWYGRFWLDWPCVPCPTPAPTRTPRPTYTLYPTPTREETGTPTRIPTWIPIPTWTPMPTRTPTATPCGNFTLTVEDWPDPVPATHRIRYTICAVNDGDAALTDVKLISKWTPLECAYLPPENPSGVTWEIDRVNPHSERCVVFYLDTRATCTGQTVTNDVRLECTQGWAETSELTRIVAPPTPGPTNTTAPTPMPTNTPQP